MPPYSSGYRAAKVYERVYTNYYKRVINVKTYANTQAAEFKWSVTPSQNHAKLLVAAGIRKKILLNQDYLCAKSENHARVEKVKYFFYVNGFSFAWNESHHSTRKAWKCHETASVNRTTAAVIQGVFHVTSWLMNWLWRVQVCLNESLHVHTIC